MKKERPQHSRSALCFLAVVAGALVASTGVLTAATYRPVVGEPFPGLVLPALEDGTPLSIAAFRGQKVILHVFASW